MSIFFCNFARKINNRKSIPLIIMEYNKEQKMAMSKVLVDILSIDEHIDVRETMYFETIKEKLQLPHKTIMTSCISIH